MLKEQQAFEAQLRKLSEHIKSDPELTQKFLDFKFYSHSDSELNNCLIYGMGLLKSKTKIIEILDLKIFSSCRTSLVFKTSLPSS